MAHDRERDPVEPLRKDSPELAMLFDAFRMEFDAKLSMLKAWGIAACLASGAVGGFVTTLAELIRPGSTAQALAFVAGLFA